VIQIRRLTALHVRIPLRRPVRHASHTRTETDNLLVRCVLDDGTEGYGEGVPREYVTGETIHAALVLLQRSELATQLEDLRDWPHVLAMSERLRLATVVGDVRGCQGNAARCAVELALLDALGRHFGKPLSSIPGLLAPELHEPKQEVRYSGIILATRGLKLRFLSWGYRFYGFHQVKVKVGIAEQNDVARLGVVRRGCGRKMDLRIDANEAWQPGEVAERIRAQEPFGITSVEQPVAHEQVRCLAEVRKQVRTPIMLDESLCSRTDAERAVREELCDLFNLRLSKCGGFIPTLRLAQLAHQHGLACQLGCQVGETAVLSAAGRHFATSVAGLRYLEGSYDRHLVREALATCNLTFRRGGLAPALPGPGLGITLDPAAVQRVMVREVELLG
jgi:muconate cycloisomerase